MQFLNAVFLWAGFAVLIPPVIHLFNFRRYKTVYFSDVGFLQNLKNITRQRSTLKQILLMVLRMLIIACLVVAFSNPVLTDKNTLENKNVAFLQSAPPIIYLDNSFSMQSGSISGLNLENAKNKALEIVRSFPETEKFMFINNDFLSEHNRLVNADEVTDFISKTQLSSKAPLIGKTIQKALQNLYFQDIDINTKKNVFIISDFQKNICDFSALQNDSLLSINLIGIDSKKSGNIAVDTVEFLTPIRLFGSQEEVLVTVRNYGDKPKKNIPIKLYINSICKCAQSFDINAFEKKQISLKYVNTEKNFVKGKITISDNPINYDDNLYFGYKIDSLKKILLLTEGSSSKYFKALFLKDGNFLLDEKQGDEVNSFSDYQTVILNQKSSLSKSLSSRLQAYVSMGGNLIFVPSFSGNIDDYNYLLSLLMCNTFTSKDTLKCKISKFNAQSPLLKNAIKSVPENVDLPRIEKYFNSLGNQYQTQEVILESDSYKKILTQNDYKLGKVFVFYTPLDEKSGNLVTHRLIVPILYNAVLLNQGNSTEYYSIIGQEDNGISINLPQYKENMKITLKAQESDFEFIPRISGADEFSNFKLFAENSVNTDGFYSVMISDKPTNEFVAFNYDRKESDLDFFSTNQIKEKLLNSGFTNIQAIEDNNANFDYSKIEDLSSKPLWKIFVLLAIAFAAIEVFVERTL